MPSELEYKFKKRTRKVEPINDFVSKEVNTSVLITLDEKLVTMGESRKKQTVAKPDTGLYMKPLFTTLWSISEIEHYAWNGFDKQKEIAFYNKQEFIDDLFLNSNRIVFTKHIASKYGFDYYSINKDTDELELTPGKTNLNQVIKAYFFCSGGRIDFRTIKVKAKGVSHFDKNYKWSNQSTEIKEQLDLVRDMKSNDKRRKLYIPSAWLNDLLIDIEALKSKHTVIKKGKSYVDLKAVKSDMNQFLSYSKYKNHKSKLKEIIEYFKTDNR